MAEVYLKRPDGAIVAVDESEAQAAADAGYQTVDQATIRQAQAAADPAAAGGLSTGESYNVPQAFAEKALSSATFGLAPGLDSAEAVAGGRRFAAENPGLAFGAELVGQLPAAIATGGAGAVLVGRAAGAGLAARVGAGAADIALGAAVGGAQTEAEETRLSGEDFSWTDAAVAGLAGEVLGRGAAWSVAKAVGGSRNLMARAARDVVAQDAEASLARGGFLNDYRIAQHADEYHNQLAELASRDLDALEDGFAEVSRQDRKRARIARAIRDAPEQAAVRTEAAAELRGLREALAVEAAEGGAPAKRLLRQLDDRIEKLDAAPTGRKLWRLLDENRQALHEHAVDLHQAYDANPGSAWLSREALERLDAARQTAVATLERADVWGEAAAAAQRAYNQPFHERYFPTYRTVRNDLMFTPHENAEGFRVFRGDPAKVRRFLARDLASPDGHRLGEQFSQYLDGVEAIARAGAEDTPQAAHRTLEAVRRLRKAVANAAHISEAAGRNAARAGTLQVAADVAAGAAGAAAFGVPGAAGFAGASRGLRLGHWLGKAAERLGWGRGRTLDMAALLAKGGAPAPARPDAPRPADDWMDSVPPDSGPPPPPGGGGGGGGGGGLTPSMRAAAADPNWRPSEPPGGTMAEDLATAPSVSPPTPREAPTRPVPGGAPEVHRGAVEALEMDPLRDARGPSQREAKRLEALAETEFRDVISDLKASGDADARELAEALESSADDLADAGLVDRAAARLEEAINGPLAPPTATRFEDLPPVPAGLSWTRPRTLDDAGARAPDPRFPEFRPWAAPQRVEPTLDDVDEFYRRRASSRAPDSGPRRTRPAPADSPSANDIRSAGLNIRMGEDRIAETLENVFGPGRAPTAEQWRQLAPLDVLSRIAPMSKARVDVLGDAFIWSAEGQTGRVAPHRRWDGTFDEGGYESDAWTISRTFSRNLQGELEVHHDHFIVRGDLQGSGVGAEVLKSMMDVYRKLGVDVVTVDAIEVGRYFWPSIGFNCSDESLRAAKSAFQDWLVRTGRAAPAEAAKAAGAVRSLPSLAQAEHAKEFLMNVPGRWTTDLSLRLNDADPMYHLMRGRLDIALGGLAVLGAGALEGGGDREGPQAAAQAAAAGGLALFGRRASLFRSARAKLVTDTARRLFSATAQPAARTAARLVYSRTQMAQRQEEFQSWATDPDALVERVAEGFREVPPEQFGAAASGVFAAATFLKERLPTVAKLNAVSLRQIPVSAEAMAKYARYEQAALNPREAIQDAAASGHLNPELLETLQALYPDLLAELRVGAIQTVQENGPPTTIQAKLVYAQLFEGRGELADPAFSPEVATFTAMAYEQQVPPQPGGGPRSSGNVSWAAAASAAPAMGRG